jgi:hypothetical protein
MPDLKRAWTDDDIAKLKDLAGTMPVGQIAAQLVRSPGATAVEACKLKLSLHMQKPPTPKNDQFATG